MGSVVVVSSIFQRVDMTEQQRKQAVEDCYARYLSLKDNENIPQWKE